MSAHLHVASRRHAVECRTIARVMAGASWLRLAGDLPVICRHFRTRTVRLPRLTPVAARSIVDQVTRDHDVTLDEIRSHCVSRFLARVRGHLCFRLFTETVLPTVRISDLVNRDRSLIILSARLHAAREGLRFQGRYWQVVSGRPRVLKRKPGAR